jgi:monoterpene epsilon-lactone hydrolase
MQKLIGAPLRQNWNILPSSGEEWRAVASAGATSTMQFLPGLRERLHVNVEPVTLDGAKAYVVTPDVIPPENRNRLLPQPPNPWRPPPPNPWKPPPPKP